MRWALIVLVLSGTAACSDGHAHLKDTTRPTYDPATGKLIELTHDANGNGRIDTWMEMDGTTPVRARIDRDEDGVLDRWEYYGDRGQLVKVGFSRRGDGRPDAWAFSGADGRVTRIEISSTADERSIDRWERYDPATAGGDAPGVLIAADDDTNGDGKPDRWETYERGALSTVAFDENHDGTPDRRLTYRNGVLVLIETEPDAGGTFRRKVPVR